MFRLRTIGAISIAALVLMSGASAQSLKEARARDAENRALEREVTYTSSVCGNDISSRIDWSTTAEWPGNKSLVAACDRALSAVEAACRANKPRAMSVSRFVCAGDGSGPDFSGATLRYGASPNTDGFSQTAAALE